MFPISITIDQFQKYVEIFKSKSNKNNAFEFKGCINTVIQKEILDEIRKPAFH